MKFKNPHHKKIPRHFVHYLLWQLGYYNDPMLPEPIPKEFIYPNFEDHLVKDQPRITWINHSSFWIQAFETNFLVDPIFSQRCSPLSFFGPKRRHFPSPSLEEIAHRCHSDSQIKFHYVIISHNHYDHLDKKSLIQIDRLFPKVVWIVPSGVKRWFSRVFPKSEVIELEWWDQVELEGCTLTAVPAQHFSGRGIFDHNRSLWMGCVVEFSQGKRFYFVGDTGYNGFDFKEIGKKFASMDLSMIPIGVYCPRRFMRTVHINPDESVKIHREVNSQLSVAGHWGTFHLSSEEMNRPPYDLYAAIEKLQVSPKQFRILIPGQTINW